MLKRSIGCATAAFLFTAVAFGATRDEEAAKAAKDLKAKDSKTKISALKTLADLGGASRKITEPHLPAILSSMKDGDAKVRAQAATTYGICDPADKKAAINNVGGILKDEKSEEARGGQYTALGQLGAAAEAAEDKDLAKKFLTEARAKATDKREQKMIQAALQQITPRKKKN